MAITRAQQFRQMLIRGGVANPDGRRGFFQGALKDAKEKNEPISPGTSVGGNTRGGTGRGRDLDVQQRGMTKSEYNRRVAEGTIDRYKGSDDPPKPPQLQEDKRFVPTEVPKGISAIERLRNDQIQKSINRNRVLALRKLGLMKKPAILPTGAIFQSLEEIPEEFELMSYDDLVKIATSGPYLSQQKTVGDVNEFTAGKDLLGKTFEAEDLLRKGDMTQDKFEELFPGPPIPEGGGGENNEPQDPCKGPNPPAYCFIDPPTDPTDPSTPSTGVFAGIAPRFAGSIFDFDALRAGAMDGGIMNNKVMGGMADGNIDEAGRQMYFLGKLVKKATRAVKKVAKSPFGKAALLGAGAYFMPGFGIKATGGFPNFAKPGGFLSKILTKGGDKALSFDNLSLGKTTALGFGIPLALDLLGVGKDDDDKMDLDEYYRTQGINIADIRMNPYKYLSAANQGSLYAADGGLMRIGYQEGGDAEPVAKKTMPLIDMDGQEKDYRETGGFVDMGRMERADDVPARLSKNEFVFTADAVRNAGEGDIDKGAEVMYNMMKNLEAGGEVSEESQGLEGAREMFKTSQRLEEVL